MATAMSPTNRREFLSEGTRTGVLSTVRLDGTPHGAPVWFVLDGDDVVFMTGSATVKGRNLRRTGRAALTVDESAPPFSYATMSGPVEISEDLDVMLEWSIRLARRYMGDDLAEQFGRRNAVAGELLVRLVPDRINAYAAVAD